MTLLRKLVFIVPSQLKSPGHLRLFLHGVKKRIKLISEKRKVTNISAPSVININLTSACNHDCKTCTYRVSNRTNVDIKFLPYKVVKKLIDEVAPYGTNLLFCGGGEPTLHPELSRIVAYASKKGLYSEITTNAFILKDKVKELVDAGIGAVAISIDGPEEIHDLVRGRKNAYARAIDSIMELNKIKRRPHVAISTTVSPISWKSLPEFFKKAEVLIKTRKVDYVMIRHMQNILGQRNFEEHNKKFGEEVFYAESNEFEEIDFGSINIEELHRLVKWSDKAFPWLFWVGKKMSVKELDTYYNEPDVFINDRRVYCPWVFVNITETGDVVLCNEVTASNNFVFGNIKEQSFLEIWNTSPKIINFRKVLQKHGKLPICARCCGYISIRI
jgi:MoaA/NifB/PqqE/SkfB family radical SAM enzyme